MMKSMLLPNLVGGKEDCRVQKQYLLETVGKKIEEICPGWLKADRLDRRTMENCSTMFVKTFTFTVPYAKATFKLKGTLAALTFFYKKIKQKYPTTPSKRGNEQCLSHAKLTVLRRRRK